MRRHKSAAQPVEIARQAVDAARSAAQNVDVDAIRDSVRSAAQNVDVEAIRDSVMSAAQSVDVDAIRDTVATEAAKDYDLVIDHTRKRPLRSLLIALGLGAVVGAVIDRRRTKKQKQQQQQRQPQAR